MSSVWLSGEMVAADRAVVGVFDHAITVGDGVFETIKVVGGRPFAPSRHLARLRRSADALGLRVPHADTELHDALAEVASAEPGDGVLRLTVTGGVSPLGSTRGDGPARAIVARGPLPPAPPDTAVVTVPWTRNEGGALAGVKSTSYAENVVALRAAHAAGASEAVLANTRGELCEGTGSNVFVALGGELVTPSLTSGCLAGITRELVLELVEVTEADLPVDVLATADEVFLASTVRDVQSVTVVDGEPVGDGGIGPLTAAAAAAFADLVAADMDP